MGGLKIKNDWDSSPEEKKCIYEMTHRAKSRADSWTQNPLKQTECHKEKRKNVQWNTTKSGVNINVCC